MSKPVLVSKKIKSTFAEVALTGSKSESNRALIIRAMSKGKVTIANLSSAEDTVVLTHILDSIAQPGTGARIVNVGPAGTAYRFLTAYLAMQQGEFVLTGSERMLERPVGILVNALRELGANIQYEGNQDYPPLRIKGPFKQLQRSVSVQGDISSQYISSLLLIAPALPLGLELNIEGELTSRPYVQMTLDMLQEAGISHEWTGNRITIAPQSYQASTLTIEPDWSAASYWYAIAALSEDAIISLKNLKEKSLQGDKAIAAFMQGFGIDTTFTDGEIILKKSKPSEQAQVLDLKECPDLAQTLIVCCAALGRNASFTGLETLRIKETDRIAALQNELEPMGIRLTEHAGRWDLDCSKLRFPEKMSIHTYHDHRMAMAFAPLALKVKEVELQDAKVVGKSYPHFWKDLENAGFDIR